MTAKNKEINMEENYEVPLLPMDFDFESKSILKQVNAANRSLAELKGVALTIPNEDILINTLTLQEARDSSAVENIVTTQDELYRADLDSFTQTAAAKEVLRYRQALKAGFEQVRVRKVLPNRVLQDIQAELVDGRSGFRALEGTVLKNATGEVVYRPPQDYDTIVALMSNLEQFINDSSMCEMDPLIKMAIIHHQFESIHPFYDGNGRTGRILAVLFLVCSDLLDTPILYLSRYITHNKGEYYRLLQEVRNAHGEDFSVWEEWVLFMLKGVEETADETIRLVKGIGALMQAFKQEIRPLLGKQYSHELLNNLFSHPYTKIEYVERDMQVHRNTAQKYLDSIVESGLMEKRKIGRSNYYLNVQLIELLMSVNESLD